MFHQIYDVTEDGQVINVKTGRVLKQYKSNQGRYDVYLYEGGKRYKYKVHRLVAMKYLPNPDNLPQVNHIDEDPSNNHVSNLEWCTAKYNVAYSKAVEYAIVDPFGVLHKGRNLSIFCEEHNLQIGNLYKVLTGERRSHKGYTKGDF